MKKAMFAAALLVTTSIATATADGTVGFYNSVLAKIKYQAAVGTPIVDAPFGTRIGIFWGTNPTNLSLVLPTTTIMLDGVFNGGDVYPIPGTETRQRVYLKFAGWDGSVGDHWSNSPAYGESSLVLTDGLGPTMGPGTVVWQSASGTSTNRVKPFTIYNATATNFQTINFPVIPEQTYGDGPIQLNAVASSGLPVTYTSRDTSVARIEGSTATIVGAGVTFLSAFQAGTATIAPASASRMLVVQKAPALISLGNLVQRYPGDGTGPSYVTVPPNLAVTFTYPRLVVRPVGVGRYEFTAAIDSRNYVGSTNGLLVVLPRLAADSAGGGTVAIEPPSGAYFEDGTARVTANAAPGWTFIQWLGSAIGSAPTQTVAMTHGRCLEAVFGTTLSAVTSTGGSVLKNPMSSLYPYGEAVQLTAIPPAGTYFESWTGGFTSTANPLRVHVVTPEPNIVASFAPLSAGSCAVTVIPDGRGRVERVPNSNVLGAGESVVLTAVPDEGQEFLGWTGDATGTTNPLTVVMTESRTITAVFSRRPRLSILGCDGGAVEKLPIVVTGDYGATYTIESRNISGESNWEVIGLLVTPFGTSEYLETLPRGPSSRIYRAVGD
ncbi:MAG: hypothetical protein IPK15_11470 [Verrucomicrobia bacterium]|nr:hypothetical protein [Verrucomicrobiota bacterium]